MSYKQTDKNRFGIIYTYLFLDVKRLKIPRGYSWANNYLICTVRCQFSLLNMKVDRLLSFFLSINCQITKEYEMHFRLLFWVAVNDDPE